MGGDGQGNERGSGIMHPKEAENEEIMADRRHAGHCQEEEREAKANGNQQKWRELDKEYNQQALEDRRKYLEEKCQEAENAHQVGNLKNVFSVVRELTNKWTPRSDVINDSNVNTLTEEADIKARWVEYSSNLYRRQPGDKPSNVETGIKEPAPLKSEVEWALKEIKDGKARGIDNLPIEIWKATGLGGIDLLWRLCVKIWKKEEWPTDWCQAVFIPLFQAEGVMGHCLPH